MAQLKFLGRGEEIDPTTKAKYKYSSVISRVD